VQADGSHRGPSIDWGIMNRAIRPVGYLAGWGFVEGMDATFGWDRDCSCGCHLHFARAVTFLTCADTLVGVRCRAASLRFSFAMRHDCSQGL
jgi:hypothetical protein